MITTTIGSTLQAYDVASTLGSADGSFAAMPPARLAETGLACGAGLRGRGFPLASAAVGTRRTMSSSTPRKQGAWGEVCLHDVIDPNFPNRWGPPSGVPPV